MTHARSIRRALFGFGLAIGALALVNTVGCSSPEDTPFMARSDAAMTRMMAAMHVKPSGDVDRDFVAQMVPHHQGAVDIAEAELTYGRNVPLRGLAQEIIATQRQQIVAMQDALDGLLPPLVGAFHQSGATGWHLPLRAQGRRQCPSTRGGAT